MREKAVFAIILFFLLIYPQVRPQVDMQIAPSYIKVKPVLVSNGIKTTPRPSTGFLCEIINVGLESKGVKKISFFDPRSTLTSF